LLPKSGDDHHCRIASNALRKCCVPRFGIFEDFAMMRHVLAATVFITMLASFALALPQTEKPLPPREAAAAMTVPPGFKVTLFAGEPDVTQPIAMCFDDRGRLWVAECHSYPKWIKDGKPGNDKILIFEDTDNDGQFDKRTVFLDKMTNLTSIEFGFGGIYALTSPYLIHIPMDAKTDRPTGPPVKLLDGWSLDAGHNMVNGLKWGPDGWLYGCHGITATSHPGKPATPKADRQPMNCGVWRFHPVTHKFEIVANGGTNPWGIDWDEQGELYFTNCVIDHAFHVIPGGHYQRMFGNDFNPHLYKLMGSCCDHIHWGGGAWTSSRGGEGKHSEAGGGHAHSGCMIYLGDNFPKEYRNCLFTGNIHGNRVNRDRIDYTAKGPVLRHEKDFLFGNDSWFRPIAMDYGPDGGVYVIDWTDTGECHNYDKAHQASGRIYKVTHGKAESKVYDRSSLSNGELLQLHDSYNEWATRHARRLLVERFHVGRLRPEEWAQAVDQLAKTDKERVKWPTSREQHILTRSIRLLYTRMALQHVAPETDVDRFRYADGLTGDLPMSLVLRSAFEVLPISPKLVKLLDGQASLVDGIYGRPSRLWLSSILQRFEPKDRWTLATALAKNEDDRDDPQIPLMLWYAVEPLPALDVARSTNLVETARIPLIRQFLSRKIASISDRKTAGDGMNLLAKLAAKLPNADESRDVLMGMQEALAGRRAVPQPTSWHDAYAILQKSASAEVRDRSRALAVIFGDERALNELRSLVKDPTAELPRRQDALKSLVFKQPDDLRGLLGELLDDKALRSPAIRALATFKDDQIPPRLIRLYPKLSAAERTDAIGTLTSRPAFALALLDAVAAKAVDRKDLGPLEVRQMLALKDAKVAARVEEVWGTLRPASKDKTALMAKYKKLLAPAELKSADHALGKSLYAKHCAACHKLFGEGGAIAPDLTGSQRANLDYVLENVLDPSAIVPREYQVTIFTTASGRTISGLVKEESDRAVSIQTQNEVVVLPKSEIDQRTASKLSMMPEGVFEQLSIAEARALVAYLGRSMPLEKR
jgi:putative membrane-bound dehydrogenase-like protein